jgi:glycosyltransferase involved in cell wall biosynthesis
MNSLLSVIVPAYNAEKYLSKCLSSLQSQTYKDIEYICIDDGSVDGTAEILQDFAKNDKRFAVTTTVNKGYGAACNLGISKARGKYVTIFESDDFSGPNFYATLIEIAERENCDFVKSDFKRYWDGGKTENVKLFPDKLYGRVLTPKSEDYNFYEMQPSIWSAIYRRELVKDIRFLETLGATYQDTSVAVKTMLAAKRAWFVKKALVNYRQHKEQSMKSYANPFAIIAEYKEIERYAAMDSKLFAAKYHRYMWNYRRINDEYKQEFLQKFSEEFNQHLERKPDIIKRELFRDGDILRLRLLLADVDEFYRMVPE